MSPVVLRWLASAAVVAGAVAMLGLLEGIVVGGVGVVPTWWLVDRAEARDMSRVATSGSQQVPLVLDLLAAALRAGQPVASALATVAPMAGEHLAAQLRQVAGLLRFGAEPATAWGTLDGSALAPVARTARRSAESGVRLAHGFELLAAELRDESRAAAVARAHRAGIWAMVPLGLCFLPAFACLGVLPVIVGIAHGVLNGTVP